MFKNHTIISWNNFIFRCVTIFITSRNECSLSQRRQRNEQKLYLMKKKPSQLCESFADLFFVFYFSREKCRKFCLRIPGSFPVRKKQKIVRYVTRGKKQRFRTSARIARVEIVASLRVTYAMFRNLSIVNSALWCLYSATKSSHSTPYVLSIYAVKSAPFASLYRISDRCNKKKKKKKLGFLPSSTFFTCFNVSNQFFFFFSFRTAFFSSFSFHQRHSSSFVFVHRARAFVFVREFSYICASSSFKFVSNIFCYLEKVLETR